MFRGSAAVKEDLWCENSISFSKNTLLAITSGRFTAYRSSTWRRDGNNSAAVAVSGSFTMQSGGGGGDDDDAPCQQAPHQRLKASEEASIHIFSFFVVVVKVEVGRKHRMKLVVGTKRRCQKGAGSRHLNMFQRMCISAWKKNVSLAACHRQSLVATHNRLGRRLSTSVYL